MHRPGPRLTPAQKTEVWRRWRQGESLSAIGRALGRIPKLVHYIVAGAGGVAPPPRQRSRLALTLAEREEISRGLAHGRSLRAVGRGLGRAPSTVESRSTAARRPAPVSRRRRQLPGVETESAPQALSVGHVSRAARRRRDAARVRVVAAADRRLVATGVS